MINLLNPKERDSIIVTLEGGEGSGKTTVEKELRKKLEAKELQIMPILKEPGSKTTTDPRLKATNLFFFFLIFFQPTK